NLPKASRTSSGLSPAKSAKRSRALAVCWAPRFRTAAHQPFPAPTTNRAVSHRRGSKPGPGRPAYPLVRIPGRPVLRFTGNTGADYNGWFAGKLPLITILDVEQIAIIICDREQTAARRR